MNFYLTASFLPFPSHFQQVAVVEKLEMMDELEVEALLEVSATHEANDSGEDMRVPPPAPRIPQEEFGFSDGAMSSCPLKAPASMVEEWFPRAGVLEDKEVDGSKGAVSARRHKADARPLPRRRNAFEEPRERFVVVKETMEVETMGAGATAAKGKVQFAQSPLRPSSARSREGSLSAFPDAASIKTTSPQLDVTKRCQKPRPDSLIFYRSVYFARSDRTKF
ncbi:hypothetical protein PUNSTDRAFT_134136 [Punctularia strigosozonata HHB-11173 SS5]|uniref:uncharacterized protein n=1 Tax=Punctularia strigosozonata (strain HHB-11173) TaxID=741275 RepID=UPI00044183DC|nr:uncharacterized protein PUNSTDRAFT_134136 [Punctularia strigosozonata HHB-11173 SS5]EIN08963.1 hypothetical protein PUNSTDRAFT_134136 [Punctularia strigosozonata HHB-11173 SS5]